jgi:hypothetical protein
MMKALILIILIALLITPVAKVEAQPATNIFGTGGLKLDRAREPRKDTLEDLFPRSELKEVSLTPLMLKPGKLLPGLNESAVEKLNNGYFVVINDARVADFATIYRQNRIDALSNFVTVDCIMHPFLAHRNAIKILTVSKFCSPQLKSLLEGMIAASIADYRETEDEDVKDDIQRNLAYLSVALRLLCPEDKPHDFGGVEELVRQDLENVQKEKTAPSAISKKYENFAVYRPFGWYETNDTLKNFYRSRQWLGRMFLSLTDVTNNTKAGSGNEFRRAVLLYRSLLHAKLANDQGFSAWDKLHKALLLMEESDSGQSGGDLLPDDFATAFLATEKNLHLTLQALSNPLTRTKLLLSLKSVESKQFTSTSIFELNSKNQKETKNLVFRLLPPLYPPEFDWINAQIVQDKDATTGFNSVPVSLILLHARGYRQANNILADNIWRLDQDLVSSVPDLDRVINGLGQNTSNRNTWQILTNYAKPLPDGVQSTLRTNLWLTRCLEGTTASWLDSWLALDKSAIDTKAHGAALANKSTPAAAPNQPVRKVSSFNYLEPAPEVFKRMSVGLVQFASELVELGVFPPELKERTADFHRLTERLADMARKEETNQPLSKDDAQLLANIDRLLDKISSPVAGNIFVSYGGRPNSREAADTVNTKPGITLRSRSNERQNGTTVTTTSSVSKFNGINFGLGGPGTIYILLKGARGSMLCRGAVYSFYEAPGDVISQAHWQRSLDYGLLKPPFWCDPFQLVDEASTKH